jgi:two-component system NarL family sensor kinase
MTGFVGRTRLAFSRRRRLAAPRRENRLRLALLGPLLGLALGAAGAFAVTSVWGPHIAEARAVDRAEVSAVEIAESTVGPLVTTDLLSDDGTAYRVLDEALRTLSSDGSIGRVQVRDATGRVMYAVEPALVGRRLPLAEEHHRILQTGGSDAQLETEENAENAATEANEAVLSEPNPDHVRVAVVAGFRGADGERYLLEAQLRTPRFRDAEMRLIQQLMVLVLLVVAAVFALPSSLLLARHVKGFRAERSSLVAKATNASLTERRKLAQALHDDVVHELAGLGFALSATVSHLPPRGDPDAQSMLRTADGLVGRSVVRLREILADIYPLPDEQTDLAQAVEELAEPLRAQGVRIRVVVPTDRDLGPAIRTIIFQLSRELLRNVDRHAQADHVEVRVERHHARVTLTVSDDGVGFDSSVRKVPSSGHVGLVILVDAVEELGGSFLLTSAPGRGCVVEVNVPTSDSDLPHPARIG